MGMFLRAANSIDSRLPTMGIQIGGPRLLHRTGPERDVLVGPVFAGEGKHVVGPGTEDDVVGFLEPLPRLGQRYVVDLVFARDAAGETRDQPPVGEAVEHRQFLGEAQRFVQGQEVAVDQQFQAFGALRRGGGHQVGRVHQAVRRGVMLVEADAVVAEAVHFFPGLEVFVVGADGDGGVEMRLAEADMAVRMPTWRWSRCSP